MTTPKSFLVKKKKESQITPIPKENVEGKCRSTDFLCSSYLCLPAHYRVFVALFLAKSFL